MRLHHLTATQRHTLYENLDNNSKSSILLWESAGIKLREAALTADQIQQLFQEIEKTATAQGGNRTLIGKGKDAASAVNQAWEDLKTKIQDSGPIKGFDQKVSDVLSKIGVGAKDPEFNGQVNKWVQKYRDFAEKHPIAQGAIYATLIALAGISGAGVGGAAALGLLKMADKLLQGERFSSSAYQGAKAGALAYGASKLGDYVKGKMAGDQSVPGSDSVSGASEYKGTMIANEPVIPGQPLSDTQMRVMKIGMEMGNEYPPEIMAQYNAQLSGGAVSGAADTASKTGSGIVARMDDNPMASPALKKLAAKVANGEVLSDKEMDFLDKMEIRSVKMSDMVNAPGSSGVGRAGAELTLNTGEKLTGDAAAQAANTNFGAIQDLKAKAVELAGNQKYGAADAVSGAASVDPADAAQQTLKLRPRFNPADAAAGIGDKFNFDIVDGVRQITAGDKTYTFAGLGQTPPDGVEIVKKITGQAGHIGIRGISKKVLSLGSDGKYYALGETKVQTGHRLSEGQVYMVFNRIVNTNEQLLAEGQIFEGPLDALKNLAQKGKEKLQTIGKNITTKITADKLNSAWKSAGSPTDSGELSQFLAAQGVADTVIKQVFTSLKIPAKATASGAVDLKTVQQMIAKLPTDRKVRLVKYMNKQLKVA